MTALEITTKNYNRFEDKKDITDLINEIFCVESDYSKRDAEGNKIGGFEDGVFEVVTEMMRKDFVSSKRRSLEIREFCVEVLKNMSY